MAILSFGWGQGNDRPDCTEGLAAQLARLAEQVLPPSKAPRGLREKVAVGEGLCGVSKEEKQGHAAGVP